MKINIVSEGNAWIVYRGEEELEAFDKSRMGDQVAKEAAQAYVRGYEAGYDQAGNEQAELDAGEDI